MSQQSHGGPKMAGRSLFASVTRPFRATESQSHQRNTSFTPDLTSVLRPLVLGRGTPEKEEPPSESSSRRPSDPALKLLGLGLGPSHKKHPTHTETPSEGDQPQYVTATEQPQYDDWDESPDAPVRRPGVLEFERRNASSNDPIGRAALPSGRHKRSSAMDVGVLSDGSSRVAAANGAQGPRPPQARPHAPGLSRDAGQRRLTDLEQASPVDVDYPDGEFVGLSSGNARRPDRRAPVVSSRPSSAPGSREGEDDSAEEEDNGMEEQEDGSDGRRARRPGLELKADTDGRDVRDGGGVSGARHRRQAGLGRGPTDWDEEQDRTDERQDEGRAKRTGPREYDGPASGQGSRTRMPVSIAAVDGYGSRGSLLDTGKAEQSPIEGHGQQQRTRQGQDQWQRQQYDESYGAQKQQDDGRAARYESGQAPRHGDRPPQAVRSSQSRPSMDGIRPSLGSAAGQAAGGATSGSASGQRRAADGPGSAPGSHGHSHAQSSQSSGSHGQYPVSAGEVASLRKALLDARQSSSDRDKTIASLTAQVAQLQAQLVDTKAAMDKEAAARTQAAEAASAAEARLTAAEASMSTWSSSLSSWVVSLQEQEAAREAELFAQRAREARRELNREIRRRAAAYEARLASLESKLRALEAASLQETISRAGANMLAFAWSGGLFCFGPLCRLLAALGCVSICSWLLQLCGLNTGRKRNRCFVVDVCGMCCSRGGHKKAAGHDEAEDEDEAMDEDGPSRASRAGLDMYSHGRPLTVTGSDSTPMPDGSADLGPRAARRRKAAAHQLSSMTSSVGSTGISGPGQGPGLLQRSFSMRVPRSDSGLGGRDQSLGPGGRAATTRINPATARARDANGPSTPVMAVALRGMAALPPQVPRLPLPAPSNGAGGAVGAAAHVSGLPRHGGMSPGRTTGARTAQGIAAGQRMAAEPGRPPAPPTGSAAPIAPHGHVPSGQAHGRDRDASMEVPRPTILVGKTGGHRAEDSAGSGLGMDGVHDGGETEDVSPQDVAPPAMPLRVQHHMHMTAQGHDRQWSQGGTTIGTGTTSPGDTASQTSSLTVGGRRRVVPVDARTGYGLGRTGDTPRAQAQAHTRGIAGSSGSRTGADLRSRPFITASGSGSGREVVPGDTGSVAESEGPGASLGGSEAASQ